MSLDPRATADDLENLEERISIMVADHLPIAVAERVATGRINAMIEARHKGASPAPAGHGGSCPPPSTAATVASAIDQTNRQVASQTAPQKQG